MRELLSVLSFTVCLVAAKPQYYGYNYEVPNYQQHGFVQQSQILTTPVVQQSFEPSQNFQQQQSYTSQLQFTSLPSTIVSSSYATQGTSYSDQSTLPQILTISFDEPVRYSSQSIQSDYSSGASNFDQSFNTATSSQTNSVAQVQQSTSQDVDGTLDSFNIYSTFGPNPADIAPSGQSTRNSADSVSVEALNTQPSNFQPSNVQSALIEQPLQQQQQPESQQSQALTSTVTVHKHIYIHKPPADFEESDPLPTGIVNKNKHYNILFIKAPTLSQRSQISQQLHQTESDEKTIVYVLVKKPDEENIQAKLAQSDAQNNKPEVYFIKYKAEKEKSDNSPLEQRSYEHSVPIYERSKQPTHAPQFPALEGQDILSEEEEPIDDHSTPSSVDISSNGSQGIQNQYLPPN